MSAPPTRTKQPAEARKITFDFGSKLASGDTVSAVSSITADAGITTTGQTLSGNKVTTLVSGGTEGIAPYRISCRVTTTLGETLELDVDVRVAEGEN